jgi:hypothetical protein
MIRNVFYIGRATRVSKPVYFLTVHCQISNDFFLLVHTAQNETLQPGALICARNGDLDHVSFFLLF